ncbi:MAG: bifunctional methionine sulfoxide reductase B/A protein [FCB group bacterium]|nr:bifunctional methionine sulfoxide reductase B/A protein [FCB group bacterium]
MKYNPLTEAEKAIIIDKGTEAPFSGKYYNFDENGIYTCKRCGAGLYRSTDKFDAKCGWPSFDDAIPEAVKQVPDADGLRTEILCANCGGHLGHVFTGEGFTPRNTRYCVNSLSLDFQATPHQSPTEKALFASGCFWGTEYYLQRAQGVISTTVGYTGGSVDNPTYEAVSSGTTGHVEAVEVTFDPEVISYEELAKLFFETHDPTQKNGQGPDIGSQYLSKLFYFDAEQKSIAENLIKRLEAKGYAVATQVLPAKKFWEAELYHQDYYQNNGKSPYCHFYRKLFDE